MPRHPLSAARAAAVLFGQYSLSVLLRVSRGAWLIAAAQAPQLPPHCAGVIAFMKSERASLPPLRHGSHPTAQASAGTEQCGFGSPPLQLWPVRGIGYPVCDDAW